VTDLVLETGESRSVPSVSREKWRSHAIAKMSKGYRLIVGEGKRANFHHPNHGYETCLFETARKLVAEGAVTPVGTHRLGTIYTLPVLSPADERPPAPPASRDADADDEFEPLDLSEDADFDDESMFATPD
jgi:hypothetical protein